MITSSIKKMITKPCTNIRLNPWQRPCLIAEWLRASHTVRQVRAKRTRWAASSKEKIKTAWAESMRLHLKKFSSACDRLGLQPSKKSRVRNRSFHYFHKLDFLINLYRGLPIKPETRSESVQQDVGLTGEFAKFRFIRAILFFGFRSNRTIGNFVKSNRTILLDRFDCKRFRAFFGLLKKVGLTGVDRLRCIWQHHSQFV